MDWIINKKPTVLVFKKVSPRYIEAIKRGSLLKKVKLEIAVNDEFVDAAIEAISKAAKTGTIGDGKIFVLDLQECVRIRTSEKGNQPIG